ncbi:hypothetical protein GCM10009113_10590 [Marinobacter szutsaonensis]
MLITEIRGREKIHDPENATTVTVGKGNDGNFDHDMALFAFNVSNMTLRPRSGKSYSGSVMKEGILSSG